MSERLGKWLTVVDERPSPSGKTRVFAVYPASRELTSALDMPGRPGTAPIGHVSWYGPWRQYALYPERDTVFEQDCLRAIAAFCEKKTSEHRARLKAVRG